MKKALAVFLAICAITLTSCGGSGGAKPTTIGVTEVTQTVFDQMNIKISALQAQVATLQGKLDTMQNTLNQINAKIK